MVRYLTLVLTFFLASCAETVRLYIPEGGAFVEGGGCSSPWASFSWPLASEIDGFVSAIVSDNGWALHYGFSIAKGSSVRFAESVLELRSREWSEPRRIQMESFQLSVYGGLPDSPEGYIKYFNPSEELVYTGLNEHIDAPYLKRDSFRSSIKISAAHPGEFELRLPYLFVNGNRLQMPEIKFRYLEHRYFPMCVQ